MTRPGSRRYCVIEIRPDDGLVAVVSGMGRHRGTWDADHSRRQAQRHAQTLRRTHPNRRYRIDPTC